MASVPSMADHKYLTDRVDKLERTTMGRLQMEKRIEMEVKIQLKKLSNRNTCRLEGLEQELIAARTDYKCRINALEQALERISRGKKLPTGVIDWRMNRVEQILTKMGQDPRGVTLHDDEYECDEDDPKPVDDGSFIVHEKGARSGHLWTDEEEEWLVTKATQAIENSLDSLAEANGRTPHALRCRLEQLGIVVDG